ncbi:hypothetical protein [Desulfuromusa kysingii]|uniref:hypothetical protein n=1 Tax=Desulfuromusa kysingii TaxID=37625 RepID=UPI000B86E72B|nr:hypothetical protein [Desulfuromusa kysingii]
MNRVLLILVLLSFSGGSFTVLADQFVDPMRPVDYEVQASKLPATKGAVQAQTRDWQLTAVLTSQDRAIAVINGESLQVGERLEGYELVQIHADRVTLKNKQGQLVLRRAGTGLKKVLINKGTGKGSKL